MNSDKHRNQCKGRTKAGKPCRAAATGGGLCFLHANPKKAAELGRMGGLKNRHFVASSVIAAVPPLDSTIAVRNAIAQVFGDVYSGRMNPKVGSSLATLLTLELRTIDMWDTLQEIEKLRKEIAEVKASQWDGKGHTLERRETDESDPADDTTEAE
jgi:hypothetical protein